MADEEEPTEEEMAGAVTAAIPDSPQIIAAPQQAQVKVEYLPLEEVAAILQTDPKTFIEHYNANDSKRNIATWYEEANKLFFSRMSMCRMHMAECNIFEDDPSADNLWSRIQKIVDVADMTDEKLMEDIIDPRTYTETVKKLKETRGSRRALKDKATQYRNSAIDYNKLMLAKQSIDHNTIIVILPMLTDQQNENAQMAKEILQAMGGLEALAKKYAGEKA